MPKMLVVFSIHEIALLFRNATGDKVQKNTHGSDTCIPTFGAEGNYIQFTQPFIIPAFNMPTKAVTASVGQSVPITAVASIAPRLSLAQIHSDSK